MYGIFWACDIEFFSVITNWKIILNQQPTPNLMEIDFVSLVHALYVYGIIAQIIFSTHMKWLMNISSEVNEEIESLPTILIR